MARLGRSGVRRWDADAEAVEAAAFALPARPGEEPPEAAASLPLLAAARPARDRATLRWRLDLAAAPFLDHHRFDGVPVLPVAAAMQAFAEAPRALGDLREVVAIEDLRVLGGVTLADGPQELLLSLGPPNAAGLRGATLAVAADPGRPRYRATLRLADAVPDGEARPASGRLPAWTGPDMAAIYRRWLSHGPRFQTIASLDALTPSGMRATARGTEPEGFVPEGRSKAWAFDPGLLDGMLQLLWVWARAMQDASALPLRAESVRRFAGDPRLGPVLVEIDVLTPVDSPQLLSTLRAFDAAGRPCYVIERFHGQSSRALNRLGGGWQGGEGAWLTSPATE